MKKSIVPNELVYSYLKRISGPQSASGQDTDLNTDSDAEDTVFAYRNPSHVTLISRINIEFVDNAIRNDRFAGMAGGVLASGCLFRVVDSNGGMRLDFLDGVPIVRSADFAALAGVDAILSAEASSDLLPVRFSIFKASMDRPLRLERNFRLEWINRDNLSSIDIFRIMVQGMVE